MLTIFCGRAGKPTPTLALIVLEPFDSLLNTLVFGRDPHFAGHDNREASAISIWGIGIVRLFIQSLIILPIN